MNSCNTKCYGGITKPRQLYFTIHSRDDSETLAMSFHGFRYFRLGYLSPRLLQLGMQGRECVYPLMTTNDNPFAFFYDSCRYLTYRVQRRQQVWRLYNNNIQRVIWADSNQHGVLITSCGGISFSINIETILD